MSDEKEEDDESSEEKKDGEDDDHDGEDDKAKTAERRSSGSSNHQEKNKRSSSGSSDPEPPNKKPRATPTSETDEVPSSPVKNKKRKMPSIDHLEDAFEPEELDAEYSLEDLMKFCSKQYISMPPDSTKEDYVKTVADFLIERKKALQNTPES